MENVTKEVQAMYDTQPIECPSEDYEQGYNAGWTDAVAGLAGRLDIELAMNDRPAITKGGFYFYLHLKEQFDNRIHEILDSKCKLKGMRTYNGNIKSVEFEGGMVEIETLEESGCSCCSDETHYYSFPIDYLFDDGYVEKVKQEIKLQEEAAERKKQEEAEKRKREQEEQERKEFERLQKKYGEVK